MHFLISLTDGALRAFGAEFRYYACISDSGHKNYEASIRSYSKTDICTKRKMPETLTAECEVISYESKPVVSHFKPFSRRSNYKQLSFRDYEEF